MKDATHDDYAPQVDHMIANLVAPTPRVCGCPGCGLVVSVRAIRLDSMWHYRGKCPACGVKWSDLAPIRTKCPTCGKVNMVTNANQFGGCQACKKTKEVALPYKD